MDVFLLDFQKVSMKALDKGHSVWVKGQGNRID